MLGFRLFPWKTSKKQPGNGRKIDFKLSESNYGVYMHGEYETFREKSRKTVTNLDIRPSRAFLLGWCLFFWFIKKKTWSTGFKAGFRGQFDQSWPHLVPGGQIWFLNLSVRAKWSDTSPRRHRKNNLFHHRSQIRSEKCVDTSLYMAGRLINLFLGGLWILPETPKCPDWPRVRPDGHFVFVLF